MKILDLIEVYCAQLTLRPRTVSVIRSNLMNLAGPQTTDLPEKFVTEKIGAYLQSLQKYAVTTRCELARQMRCFLRWAHQEGYLARDYSRGWDQPQRRPQGWIPSVSQVLAVLAAPADPALRQREHRWLLQRDQLVLEILYGTGLRRSECSALNREDWDRDLSGLWVRRGKGQKDRLQPVGTNLAQRIEFYLESVRPQLCADPDEPALLLTRAGRRFFHYNVAEIVRSYGRKLQLPKLTAHSLRRAYANHMLQNGASLAHLQLLLSHQSPETTLCYVQTTLEELRQEYRRCHPRARRRGRPV